jgi:hypothetical protein
VILDGHPAQEVIENCLAPTRIAQLVDERQYQSEWPGLGQIPLAANMNPEFTSLVTFDGSFEQHSLETIGKALRLGVLGTIVARPLMT